METNGAVVDATKVKSMMYGLTLLMQAENSHYFKNLDSCAKWSRRITTHPFGLSFRDKEENMSVDSRFTGACATDMSVECFLAHVRFWVDSTPEGRVKKLRLIYTPFSRTSKPNHHYVFFELWNTYHMFLSGETTDFSGAGLVAMQQLVGVFNVLSVAFNVQIEECRITRPVNFKKLYTCNEDY